MSFTCKCTPDPCVCGYEKAAREMLDRLSRTDRSPEDVLHGWEGVLSKGAEARLDYLDVYFEQCQRLASALRATLADADRWRAFHEDCTCGAASLRTPTGKVQNVTQERDALAAENERLRALHLERTKLTEKVITKCEALAGGVVAQKERAERAEMALNDTHAKLVAAEAELDRMTAKAAEWQKLTERYSASLDEKVSELETARALASRLMVERDSERRDADNWREIAAATAVELETARVVVEAAAAYQEYCDHEGDFRNGVTDPNNSSIDEGVVTYDKYRRPLVEALAAHRRATELETAPSPSEPGA